MIQNKVIRPIGFTQNQIERGDALAQYLGTSFNNIVRIALENYLNKCDLSNVCSQECNSSQ